MNLYRTSCCGAAVLPAVLELRQRTDGKVGPVPDVVPHEAQDGELVATERDRIRLAFAAEEVVSPELGNLIPADVYFGRGKTILLEERISNAGRPSKSDACSIAARPHNIKSNRARSSLRYARKCLKLSDGGRG